MSARTESDEFYVLDLAEEILGVRASRQHRFDWLRGDYSVKRGSFSYLPVDGYWESLKLVIEYAERQHSEHVKIFDQKDTISGVSRGEQRRMYDERRVALVPANDLRLVVIPSSAFVLKRRKITREHERDIEVVRGFLGAVAQALDEPSDPRKD